MILNALGVEVHVNEQGAIEVGLAISMQQARIVSQTPGGRPQTPAVGGRAPSGHPADGARKDSRISVAKG